MTQSFTLNQKRHLAVLTVIALGFGAYFVRGYVLLIAVAAAFSPANCSIVFV